MEVTNFSLPDQNGRIHTLADYKGKWIILYFYPEDDTPGCTTEACNFRDDLEKFRSQDVIILGVSKDSVNSHDIFSKKYNLNFPILSDVDLEVIKKYNAWNEDKKTTRRITYLIDPNFKIKKTYENVNATNHPSEILEDLQNFQ